MLYKLINTRMSAKPTGTVIVALDKTRPFIFNGTEYPGVYYDLVENPLASYIGAVDFLDSYPLKLLKDFTTSELTLYESLLPSLAPSVPGAPQRDTGYVWQYLLLAAMSQDRVKQVLEHIKGPVGKEVERLRGKCSDELIKGMREKRAREWDECVEGLERVGGLQGRAMRAFGEMWVKREPKVKQEGQA
ncbi:hypothetical protein CLAFUW4_05944 [Fulvia fulva]|uniref:Uncharacterized protein n=1 Tax=Passalora fulva TaxID=5499 RepID=A0A9Q8P9E3_PASFU|nr:uncharacterized protein CLAFUR5_06088 [Fulvia fulva]KAK4623796.1 hypothetical protein CLAFUR4_05949 [Fulvia fulva]KAK4625864.1 hypothetical protein CLAFUR0_05951 [Fulvia fulva]UJO17972.1 hypothetical protein CLAFUR5_06088 [Fulvia fulva]WPV14995.1 hypothetical protein CLAFUW4_05944 [Fulvia fulva]WPV30106.1 hypothetical protein CLAFUW7_05942 [Fulvia fulva]